MASLPWKLVISLVLALQPVNPQDLEPVNKINISAIVTNTDNDYTDIYVETNNKSDVFHRAAHLNQSSALNLMLPPDHDLLKPSSRHVDSSTQKSLLDDSKIPESNFKMAAIKTTSQPPINPPNIVPTQSSPDKEEQQRYSEESLGIPIDKEKGEVGRKTDPTEKEKGIEEEGERMTEAPHFPDPVTSQPSKYVTLNYVAKMLIKDRGTGNQYTITELHSKDEETVKLSLVDPRRNATSSCSLYTGGFGHATTGVRCRLSRNLPQECFCWDGLCLYPFLTLSSTIQHLAGPHQSGSMRRNGSNLFTWEVQDTNLNIRAQFRLVDGYLVPLEVEISGLGYSLGSKEDRASIQYSILQFEPMDPVKLRMLLNPEETEASLLQQDPGIFCPKSNLHPPRTLPDLPNQFSVKIETIIKGNNHVTYSHHNYDLQHKLVSVKLTPRVHTPPSVFLTTLALAPHLLPQTLNIIHDFNTGLQYTVSERTGNCTVETIPSWLGDAAKMDGRPVRLKLASELLQVNPVDFVYSGRRKIRGISADVWTAEKEGETEADEYSTIELYFSDIDWTMQMEEMNEIKNVPLGMATYYADSRTAPYFHTKIVSHYFEFSGSHPSWKMFDISKCLSNADRLYLRMSLHVSYGQLVQFSLATAQDSIRAALAKNAKVSPLRLVDLFLSSSKNKNSVDVWFVLLEKPEISLKGDASTQTTEGTLAEAYKTLAFTLRDEKKLRLQLDSERNMLVGVIPGSLQVVGETGHPSSRNRSYLFLRTHYTAGSMAGLGFSMAVLGLSLGILVGFLLWKRRLGLPNFPHIPHLHLPHCQATPILSSPTTDMAQLTPAYPGPPLHEPRY